MAINAPAILDESTTVITREYLDERADVLRDSVAKGASRAEFEQFMHLCVTYELDPFRGEIYYVAQMKRTLTSRDGYRRIARRNPRFISCRSGAVYAEDDFTFEQRYVDGELVIAEFLHKPNVTQRGAQPIGAWAIAQVTGEPDDIVFAPMAQYAKRSDVWRNHADAMIRKCAEVVVLRAACDIHGLYTSEEMDGQPTDAADTPISAAVEEDTPAATVGDPERARRRAFALADKVLFYLKRQEVDGDMLWAYVRTSYGVASRSELTPIMWNAIADKFDRCLDRAGRANQPAVDGLAKDVLEIAPDIAPVEEDADPPADAVAGNDTMTEPAPDEPEPEPTDDDGAHYIDAALIVALLDALPRSDNSEQLQQLQDKVRAAYARVRVVAVRRMGEATGRPLTPTAFEARLSNGESALTATAIEILARLCVDDEMWDEGNRDDIKRLWADHTAVEVAS